MSLPACNRFLLSSPIMTRQLPFGEQPVIDITAIVPSASLIEEIREASDLVP